MLRGHSTKIGNASILYTAPGNNNVSSPLDLTALPPGTMLAGPLWSKPVRLLGAEKRDGIILLHLDGMGTKMYGPGQLDGVSVVEPAYGKPWKAHAYVSILRHERARNLGIAGNADPLPHQLESIYHITGIPGPIRFLLADEPGAGKTAVASRIIQELMLQRRVRNVLVVVPAQLKTQWKSEMARFANIPGHIVEGQVSGNPWISDRPVLITSMDFAKYRLDTLDQARFDLVVVDEAHNLNATHQEGDGPVPAGRNCWAGISTHMLFLTATPHRGKPDNFRLLLKLLEPDLFSNPENGPTRDDVPREKTQAVHPAHQRSDMVDMDGRRGTVSRAGASRRCQVRHVADRGQELYRYNHRPMWGASYKSCKWRPRHQPDSRRSPCCVIQKRMASSTRALLEIAAAPPATEARGPALKESRTPTTIWTTMPYDGPDDMDEDDLDDMEENLAAVLHVERSTAGDLKAEMAELDGFIEMARGSAAEDQTGHQTGEAWSRGDPRHRG